ncbi:MAG: phage portal protein [Planctomycetia bacterium]|nr:phage portal protein [Planctomycetia bacterium]
MLNSLRSWFRRPPAVEERSTHALRLGGGSWFYNLLGDYSRAASGETVTTSTALQTSAVYAAVKVISESVASMPLHVFERRPDGSRQRVYAPTLRAITEQPNSRQTLFECIEQLTAHALLRGDGIAAVLRDQFGNAAAIVPMHPDHVTIEQVNGESVYTFRDARQKVHRFTSDEVLHLRGMTWDGIRGMSLVAMAREAIGANIALDKYAGKFFANNARPSGILSCDGPLKPEAASQMRTSWNEVHAGADSAHKVAVLTDGMKWSPISLSNEDSQFIESRRFGVEEICRVTRIPPHLLGDLSHATFSNVENLGLQFVTFTLLPWIRRWEEVIQRDLIADPDLYCEFKQEVLLRGDINSRYAAYMTGRQGGWLSANDIRTLENMDGIGTQGDVYLTPMNMEAADESKKPKVIDKPTRQNGHSHGANGHAASAISWRS